jgi:hypothetical protein
MQDELWTKAIANAHEQAEKTLQAMGTKIDSVFAISPVLVMEIGSTIFPKDRAGAASAERVVVTGSNIPTAERRKGKAFTISSGPDHRHPNRPRDLLDLASEIA